MANKWRMNNFSGRCVAVAAVCRGNTIQFKYLSQMAESPPASTK